MIAKREIWNYADAGKVWVGKYKNSHNLLHWHYDCEFLYVEHGRIDVFCERRKHTLSEGEALFVDSGQVHYMSAREPDTVLIVIIFDQSIIRPIIGNYRLASPKLYASYPVAETYKSLRSVLTDKKPFFDSEAACQIAQMMIPIFRNEHLIKKVENDKTAEAFKTLLEIIAEEYGDYTFEDAVAFMGMSDAYFSRYFKSMTGTTFSQYLNYVRTNNAVRLLQTQHISMTEVAERCGFATIRNFNRIFKELTGYSPSQLPEGFTLDEQFSYPSDAAFNPTLYDCELIESTEGTTLTA